MNRVQVAIDHQKENIKQRRADGRLTQEALGNLNKTLDMDLEEFVKFQELKSLAFASNKLTLDEAQLIFNLLGGTPDHFNGQPVEVKVVLTGLFTELLRWKMAA